MRSTLPARGRRGGWPATWSAVVGAMLLALGPTPASAAPATRPAPVTRAAVPAVPGSAADREATRRRWEAVVQFFGEEDNDRYSLRVADADVRRPANFVFGSVWKYDRATGAWVRLAAPSSEVRVVLPMDKPIDAVGDGQVLALLPVTLKDVGLFYTKWTVDGVPCAMLTRLGPPAPKGAQPTAAPRRGEVVADVPVDQNKAERLVVPDPGVATKEK